jgi:hypothetical protein
VTLKAGQLHIDIRAANGLVIFRAECDGEEIDLPLDPEVAQAIAVRLMVAKQECEEES